MSALERRPWLTPVIWTAVCVTAALQVWGGLYRAAGQRLADLNVYLGSLRMLYDGGSLYDFAAAHTGAPFTYPPFAAVVFAPLPLFPYALVAALWTLATLGAVIAIAAAVANRAGLPARPGTALVALALVASAPISSNVRFGQISVFLVLAVMLDSLHVIPPRYRGIATGIAGAVKLTPLIFVPYYWFSGQRRTAVTAIASFVAATTLAWTVLPGESARFWFTAVWNVNRVGNISTGGNQALNGVLLRWEVPDQMRTVAVALIGAAVVGLALWRATRAHRAGHQLTATVLVGASGLVLSPVSWTHHQIWLVPAAFLIVGTRPRAGRLWAGLVLAVMVLPVTSTGARLSDQYLTGNARLWLAVAIAAVVPFLAVRARQPWPGASQSSARVTAS